MRTKVIWVFTLAAALAIMPLLATLAGSAQYGSDTGIYVAKTCSGQDAVQNTDRYVFGMKDAWGGCSTRVYVANNYDEALGCARKSCPKCEIEDLTWTSRFSTSVPGLSELNSYCPAK